ncbi:MAG: GDYXXLXY domain-containing protein [Deltaproteobacteria bacterium]|jgi:uncharacterized membrane-anchored protein|nr:GDYXXLXY domain-containing protein [Deltaproteobacteria bacterium]
MNALTGTHLAPRPSRLLLWLRDLLRQGLIPAAVYAAAAGHFKLQPDAGEWRLFAARLFAMLAALLAVCGLIFLVAWNWEDLPPAGKFALLETIFVLCGLWSFWRWKKTEAHDKILALFLAALLAGPLLALYGQVYQTGADAWELFRAWGLLTLILAPAGRNTAFWFLAWLTGSLAVALYLFENHALRPGFFSWQLMMVPCLILVIFQFVLLALSELPGRIARETYRAFDPQRRLRRLVGWTAFSLLSSCLGMDQILSAYGETTTPYDFWPWILYFICSGTSLYVYYWKIPDIFLLSCSILSAAFLLGQRVVVAAIQTHAGPDSLLLVGLCLIGLGLGTTKLILFLRRNMRERDGRAEETAGQGEHGEARPLPAEEEERRILSAWLLERDALPAPALEDFFQRDAEKQAYSEPWFSGLFTRLIILVGAALLIFFIIFIKMDGDVYWPVLVLLCAASVLADRSLSPAARHTGRVLGVCALIYALPMAFEFSHIINRYELLLAGILTFFWITRRHAADQTVAAVGALLCLALYLKPYGRDNLFHWLPDPPYLWHNPQDILFALVLLFALFQLNRAPRTESNPGLRIRLESAAWGGLIFCVIALLYVYGQQCLFNFLPMSSYLDHLPLFILARHTPALALLLAAAALYVKTPAGRGLIPLCAAPCIAITYFMPISGLGLALLFLARATQRNRLFHLAAVCMGLGIFTYYYSLALPLRDKGIFLLAAGLGLLMFVPALRRRCSLVPPLPLQQMRPSRLRFYIAVILLLFLTGYNLSILQKENLLHNGRRVILALAPADPRSLMQGDYMSLNFSMEDNIRAKLNKESPRRGLAVLRLRTEEGFEDEGVFVRMHDGRPLARDEALLEFKNQLDLRIKISSGSFFFEEGLDALYAGARYAELRVDDAGRAMIKALLDQDKMLLNKDRFKTEPIE